MVIILFLVTSLRAGISLIALSDPVVGVNLPPQSYLENTTPAINDRGDVAFRFRYVSGTNSFDALAFQTSKGQFKMFSVKSDLHISDPAINEEFVIAGTSEFGPFNDFLLIDIKNNIFRHLNPFGATQDLVSGVQFLTNDEIIYRRTTSNQRIFESFNVKTNQRTILLNEDQTEFSYLFLPYARSAGKAIFKARLGRPGEIEENQPDRLYIYTEGGLSLKISDRDDDSRSPFAQLRNGASVSKQEQLAFVARKKSGKSVLIVDEKEINFPEIQEVEYFTPIVNDNGEVAFRFINQFSQRAIGLLKANGRFEIVAVEGQEILPGLIIRKDLGFGGGIDLNNLGQVTFHALLESPTGYRAGIFVFR